MKIRSDLYTLGKSGATHPRAHERKPVPKLTVADTVTTQAGNLQQSGENLEAARSRLADASAAREVLDFVKLNMPSQNAENLIKDSEESRARIADLLGS